jgi:hypothetical protein
MIGRGRLLGLLMPATLLLVTPASAAVRAVFVGVDDYAFSRPAVPAAGFANLRGAVADTGRIKAALTRSLGLALDQPGADCRSQNPVSITLTNRCATRSAIFSAWTAMIGASAPGDTLILYFAGHGAQVQDTRFSQASGTHSTLMAHDARNPSPPADGTAVDGEILDTEVREVIDAATRRGIRVITWFDSCHSGTANRGRPDTAARWAPALTTDRLPASRVPALRASRATRVVPGWRVHFGAAQDGQSALERSLEGAGRPRAGLFTRALASALEAMPDATFEDLAARVRDEVASASDGQQQPHAEGALRATITGQEVPVPSFAVLRRGDALTLQGGWLVGVTNGSRFALFADMKSALAGSAAGVLATAKVVEAGPTRARLQGEGAAAPLPAALFARELSHDFGSYRLPLAVRDAAAQAVVAQLEFVRVEPQAPFVLAARGDAMLLARDSGAAIARLPLPDAPDFALRLAWALEKVARVESWLAMVPPAPGLAFCLWPGRPDAGSALECPSAQGPTRLPRGRLSGFSVRSEVDDPRHVYLLGVSPDYSVTVVLPTHQGRDNATAFVDVRTGTDIAGIEFSERGPYRFVALSTALPIDPGVLAQTGAGVLEREACFNPGEQGVFCPVVVQARSGAQGDAWSAIRIDAEVPP